MRELFEQRKDNLLITTNPEKIDIEAVQSLFATYWASRRSQTVNETAISNSLCFSLYKDGIQVGFARIVTDYATFVYLCDVIIEVTHRGQGLGSWLIDTIISHPDIAPLRRILLVTKDAHGLYEKLGFKPIKKSEQYLERLNKKGSLL